MEDIAPSSRIYLAKSLIPNAGRGVFASLFLPANTIIESCPVIELPQKHVDKLRQTLLSHYYFAWGKYMETVAICLGFGSLYNHSYSPNATYIKHIDKKVINFITLRPIHKDEEITVNYNKGNPYDKSPLWMNDVPPPST